MPLTIQNIIANNARGFIYGAPISFSNLKSVSFDGVDEYLDLGRLTMLESTANFSVSMWWKSSDVIKYFGRLASSSDNFYVNTLGTTTPWQVNATLSNGGAATYTRTNSVTAPFHQNQWNHVCVVYDGSLTGNLNRLKIFVNGINGTATSSGTIPATTSSDTQSFYTGAINNIGTASNFDNSQQDEFSFFDYSLSQSEVTEIYNSGCPNDLMTLAAAKRPEHYYRMGDGDTFPTLLDSGETGGNNGTMTNGESTDIVTNSPCGFNNYSVAFDGVDEYANLGRLTATESATNFTFSGWYKPTTSGSSYMIGRYQAGDYVIISNYLTQPAFEMEKTIGFGCNIRSTTAMTVNAWNHVVIAYDGGGATDNDKVKIYVDGVLTTNTIVTSGVPTSFGSATTDFNIGKSSNLALHYAGHIDELGFFDYTMSGAEVTDLYNSGVPNDLMELASAKQPEHYYRMGDNDTYPTISDVGATGTNDGTMTNAESSDINGSVPLENN